MRITDVIHIQELPAAGLQMLYLSMGKDPPGPRTHLNCFHVCSGWLGSPAKGSGTVIVEHPEQLRGSVGAQHRSHPLMLEAFHREGIVQNKARTGLVYLAAVLVLVSVRLDRHPAR